MAISPSIDRIRALARAGRAKEAGAEASALVARRDADAIFELATWSLTGEMFGRDLGRARDLFGRAAAAGHPDAPAVFTAFLANGTGGPREWQRALAILGERSASDPDAADQLTILKAMTLGEDGGPRNLPALRALQTDPYVARAESFLTAAECDHLVGAASALFEPSVVIHPQTGAALRDPIRTSDVAAFPLALENPVVHALNRRIAALSDTDPGQGEPLQVLRYGVGQEYKPHLDALPAADNQRVLTVLVYLNDDFTGGATCFPRTGIRVSPGRGDALVFTNTGAGDLPDPRTLHAGEPVTAGIKYLASRWIRARPLVY